MESLPTELQVQVLINAAINSPKSLSAFSLTCRSLRAVYTSNEQKCLAVALHHALPACYPPQTLPLLIIISSLPKVETPVAARHDFVRTKTRTLPALYKVDGKHPRLSVFELKRALKLVPKVKDFVEVTIDAFIEKAEARSWLLHENNVLRYLDFIKYEPAILLFLVHSLLLKLEHVRGTEREQIPAALFGMPVGLFVPDSDVMDFDFEDFDNEAFQRTIQGGKSGCL